jgi:hypothetical protein
MSMNIEQWIHEENSAARQLLVNYSRMFNRLDANEFVLFLGDFVTYESQSVFDVMRGKLDVKNYFRGKINAIKGSANTALVRVDVGEIPGSGDCALLYQARSDVDRSLLDFPLGLMTIKADGTGKAGEMLRITVAPSPLSAKGKGLFPGLDDLPMHPHQRPLLHPVGDHGEMKIELWLLDGNISADSRAQSVLNEAIKAFPGTGYQEYRLDALSDDGSVRLKDSGLYGFPGVVVYWKGKLVFRMNGCPGVEQLIAKLRNEIY